ncbi:MAG: YlmC/YmxH family sporulation protein [Clostridiales bacterium]|jgi:YlmC/YmxH family sporulation protein|nr:YlmC/YmxH family sporulation protein [Clostridiales bacterium]
MRLYEIKQKEVINVRDGDRLGLVSDLNIDETCGKICELIIPAPGRILGVFGREQEYRIPWSCVRKLGDDLIIVECDTVKVLFDC